MTETRITTVRHLKAAIKAATEILVMPRFGCSEKWVKITKAETKTLVAHLDPKATPEDHEMYSGEFGSLTGTTLYLG